MVERVLSAVELIPAGQVASYGDIGGLVGCGPRHVGAIMARYGGGVPWWRVTSAAGDVPLHLRASARRPWAAEGIAWKLNARGCRIGVYRTDLAVLATRCDALWESDDALGVTGIF